MKKVGNINGYIFDSCTNHKYSKEYIFNKVNMMEQLLCKKIEELQFRLDDLKEAKDLMTQGILIYLIKDNDSRYGYIDSEGENYEYRIINEKPILIDKKFNLYEIVEYADLTDIGQDTGNRNRTTAWIDKVVKVKTI